MWKSKATLCFGFLQVAACLKAQKTDQRMFEELPSDHTNTAKDMRFKLTAHTIHI